EIVKAIGEFRKTHTRAQTEQLVHDWYNKHDSLLARATSENQRISDRESARQKVNAYGYDNYRQAQANYESDVRAGREDYQRIRENAMLAGKIQQSLSKVWNQLRSQGMDFDWFKLRCGNSYCNQ